jgi:hypothetical protein
LEVNLKSGRDAFYLKKGFWRFGIGHLATLLLAFSWGTYSSLHAYCIVFSILLLVHMGTNKRIKPSRC